MESGPLRQLYYADQRSDSSFEEQGRSICLGSTQGFRLYFGLRTLSKLAPGIDEQ